MNMINLSLWRGALGMQALKVIIGINMISWLYSIILYSIITISKGKLIFFIHMNKLEFLFLATYYSAET